MLTSSSEDAYKVMRCCFLLGQGSSVFEVRNLLMHKYQFGPDQAYAVINTALDDGTIERGENMSHIGTIWCHSIRH